MSKFKVGDLIIGRQSANKEYGITKEGWTGIVKSAGPDTFISKGIGKWQYSSEEYALDNQHFDLYREVGKESSYKQEFMEGVDIRLLSGEIAHIDTYIHYGDGMGCWMMQVTINGSNKNIWECECVGYSSTVVSEKVKPVRIEYPEYKSEYKPVYSTGGSIITLGTTVVKGYDEKWHYKVAIDPVKFDSNVKVFDLTPKKRKRISIFNPK